MVFSIADPTLDQPMEVGSVLCVTRPDLPPICPTTPTETEIYYLTPFLFLQGLVTLVNLIVQLSYIQFALIKSFLKKGPFFTILFILSLTVSFRVLFSIFAISISAFEQDFMSTTKYSLLQSSLYVDYCSNFFSLTITFFMSLNRCLCFIAKDWNSRIFDGIHVIFPMVFSFIVSVSGAVTCIITSEIKRNFVNKLGFVDVGPNKGFRVMINRTFFLFPLGSILCYMILYWHLRKRSQLVLAKSNQSRGDQKVFIQLFITTLLYVTLHSIYEVLTIIDWNHDFSFQLFFISTLGIFNCLPEMSLPLLLICSNLKLREKISKWKSDRKENRSVPTVTARVSGTTANPEN